MPPEGNVKGDVSVLLYLLLFRAFILLFLQDPTGKSSPKYGESNGIRPVTSFEPQADTSAQDRHEADWWNVE